MGVEPAQGRRECVAGSSVAGWPEVTDLLQGSFSGQWAQMDTSLTHPTGSE